MFLAQKNIIIISPEQWGINHLSKHHYAIELSKRGNMVWFVNPASPKTKEDPIKVSSNLIVLNHKLYIRGKNSIPSIFSRLANKFEIDKLLKFTQKPDIVWSFDPYRFQWLTDFGSSLRIFHTVDRHLGAKREHILAKHADLIFSTSESLFSHLQGSNPNCFKVPHGCNVSERVDLRANHNQLPGQNKIKAVYLGNLYGVLDIDVFVKLIEHNQDVDFIFIGPTTQSNVGDVHPEIFRLLKLSSKSNVFFTGSVDASLVNNYLSMADINIVAYKNLELNPHKFMSYLLSGKVILTTPVKEYIESDMVVTAGNQEEYLIRFQEIKQNLNIYNNKSNQERRIAFAMNHTYEKVIDKIEAIITEKFRSLQY